MAEVTVKQLAEVVGAPVERLLKQIKEAGLTADAEDAKISDSDKLLLLDYLRNQRGSTKKKETGDKTRKIALNRRSVTELKVPGGGKRTKSVAVEIRKKRVYSKPSLDINKEKSDEKPEEITQLEKLRADQEKRVEERAKEKEDKKLKGELREKERLEELQKISEAKSKTEPEPDKKNKLDTSPSDLPARESRKNKPGAKKSKSDKEYTRYGRQELHVASENRGKRKKKKIAKKTSHVVAETIHVFEKPVDPVTHDVVIPETITVDELAKRMSMKAGELIKELMKMGVMATINQIIDQDTAVIVVEELGHKTRIVSEEDLEKSLVGVDDKDYELVQRPPVVTIMGHVDHGKTSLLDYIRKSKVTAGEAGGITQHIGAYHVETSRGAITFLDTPGHAAFTGMRERGALITDIVILVVAADDGVMPQTVEAVQHSKAAGVPVIVAVNKIDKEEAQPDKVKTELGNHDVIPEDWGGETVFVNVSALNGDGVDDLLEAISLQAEIMELKARTAGPAKGTVIEATLDKGRGVTSTVLVQEGTLRKGDIILAGEEYGRVRAIFDENGDAIEQVPPAFAASVIGLSSAPFAGDEVLVVDDERTAREVAETRKNKKRKLLLANQQQSKLDSLFDRMKDGEISTLNVMLKSDVQGTLEAIKESLIKLVEENEEVKVKIVGSGVGGINETDISLATASNAIVIGFNVRADATARRAASERGVEINYYSVIYELIDDVKKSLIGMLSPEFKEQIIGMAEVKEVFKSPKFGLVAGSIVTEGVVKKSQPIRVLRDNIVIYEGELESLRRFKDDVNEVKSGTECGIAVKNYNDVKVGDQIEVFEKVQQERSL